MSCRRANILIVGAAIAALTISFFIGKKIGRLELWREQREIIGLKDGDAVRFPNGALLHSSGLIEIAKMENSLSEGICGTCH